MKTGTEDRRAALPGCEKISSNRIRMGPILRGACVDDNTRARVLSRKLHATPLSPFVPLQPQRLKGQNGVLSLNAAIDTLNIAKEVSRIAPANDLLTLIIPSDPCWSTAKERRTRWAPRRTISN